jgi:hypothetical protein
MNNQDKIKEIVEQSKFMGWYADESSVQFGAEKMAEWKDQQNAFKHPLGTKLWWVGFESETDSAFKSNYTWKKREREVVATRIFMDKEETTKQIFLSGLTSYEGENWFDDDFQIMKECDGTEWHCAGYMCDTVFETKEEADKYLQWELDYQKKKENEE